MNTPSVSGSDRYIVYIVTLGNQSPPHSQVSGERHYRPALSDAAAAADAYPAARCVHTLTVTSQHVIFRGTSLFYAFILWGPSFAIFNKIMMIF